jgi:hypothetical protein
MQRAIRSLEKRRDEHIEKLQAYRENPDAFDNRMYLKGVDSEHLRRQIITTRIGHLEKEIKNFEKEILRFKKELGAE